jgi:hypothetical protein
MLNQSGALRFGTLKSESSGTLPFAVPRLRLPVHDHVHRYDDINSESAHRCADEICQSVDSDGLALLLVLVGLGHSWA